MTYQFLVGHMVTLANGMRTLGWSRIRAHSYEKAIVKAKEKYGDDFYSIDVSAADSSRIRRCW